MFDFLIILSGSGPATIRLPLVSRSVFALILALVERQGMRAEHFAVIDVSIVAATTYIGTYLGLLANGRELDGSLR